MSASISLKSSCGHGQLILADSVVGRGTGQLALALLIIAAQVFEGGTESPMSWFFPAERLTLLPLFLSAGQPSRPMYCPGTPRPPANRLAGGEVSLGPPPQVLPLMQAFSCSAPVPLSARISLPPAK